MEQKELFRDISRALSELALVLSNLILKMQDINSSKALVLSNLILKVQDKTP